MGTIDRKLKLYEATVVDFVRKNSGLFVVASSDSTFLRIMRNTINKQLAIEEDCVLSILDENKIIKVLKQASSNKRSILLFVERVLNNKETSFVIKQIKEAFSNVKIIILTADAERQRLVLLHEIGADNFISKPISINTLIEKIAFTIKPQGKIGKIIDAAKACNEKGNFEEAIKLTRQIFDIKPNSAAGLLILGDAYKGLKKKEKAVAAYVEASKEAKLYLEPLRKLAEFFGEEGDHENKLKYLERLDHLSPLNVDRKVDMGSIHVELGNEEKAEKLFDFAMKQAKKEAMNYIEEISTKIGDIYTKKSPEKAERYYRTALETKGTMLDPSDIKTFNLLGIALRKQGKWKAAISEYQRGLKICPDDENIFYNCAMAFAEGGDYNSASENIQKCLEINPKFHRTDATLCYNIGLIFTKAREHEQARFFLEHALQLNSSFAKAQRLLDSLAAG